MPNCNEYQEMISRLLDDELCAEEAQMLHAHISECDECRRLYDAFSAVSGAIAGDMEEPPEELAAGIMFKVRAVAAPKKRRFKISHYAALAACLAVVILAASRSDLFRGVAKETAPLAPDASVSMQSKASPADDGLPVPMPETAVDMLCDAEAEICIEDDSAFGYSIYAEESANAVNDEMDSGISAEPASPEGAEGAVGFEPQEMPYGPEMEVLIYQGVRYELLEYVSELPEEAVFIDSSQELFGVSFGDGQSPVYELGDAFYIRTASAQFALYRK